MYNEPNFLTPRERINEELLRRALNDTPTLQANAVVRPQENPNTHTTPNRSWGLEGYPLASVYAPLQEWKNVYETELGFSRGTIFKELDLPFLCGEKQSGGGCCGR